MVFAAFFAVADRLRALRFDAAARAFSDSADFDTVDRGSRFSAAVDARDLAADVFFVALVVVVPFLVPTLRFEAFFVATFFAGAFLAAAFLAAAFFVVAFLAGAFPAKAFDAAGFEAAFSAVAVPFAEARPSVAAFFFVALPAVLDGGTLTPARRASESPIAMACFADLTPCLPWRTLSISWRTYSPACVDADLPSRLSRTAFAAVCFNGMGDSGA